jgi:hypothetical protein
MDLFAKRRSAYGTEITISQNEGTLIKFELTPDAAAIFADALRDFAQSSVTGGEATKLPKTFAVGSGCYEKLVLPRFDNEAPYALTVHDAAELGHALVD